MARSRFSEKLFGGVPPEDADWTDYLREAHERAPSMTPPVFGECRAADGRNSYETLAAVLDGANGAVRVVDLACGDGHLLRSVLPKLPEGASVVGIDMVESDLERARADYPDPRVRFVRALAQDLPLESSSVDFLLCHMALMLMRPAEPAVKEARRVLRPGGRLAAVIGGAPAPGSLGAEIGGIIRSFLKARFPGMAALPRGDPRFATDDGLRALFGPDHGFGAGLRIEDFVVGTRCGLDGFWELYKNMYSVGILPPELKPRLRAELEAFLKPRLDADGLIRVEFPMRLFLAAAR